MVFLMHVTNHKLSQLVYVMCLISRFFQVLWFHVVHIVEAGKINYLVWNSMCLKFVSTSVEFEKLGGHLYLLDSWMLYASIQDIVSIEAFCAVFDCAAMTFMSCCEKSFAV